MSDIQHTGDGSPFDAIRITTAEGREYWSARDLMPLLGYERWERFADAIGRAKVAAHNSGHDVARNFPTAEKVFRGAGKNPGGRPAEDYHLSRYACYLIALNGDPRKDEVAAAQTYFVIRTREAETRPVAVALPSKRELAQMVIAAEDRADEAERQRLIERKGREASEAYAKELEPKAEYVDNFVSPDDCILFRTMANQLDMQETALRELLVEKKRIYKQFIGRRFSNKAGKLVDEYEWRAYADYKNYFRLFPQHNAPRHHNNQLRQTLYITPPGAQAIQKLAGVVVSS